MSTTTTDFGSTDGLAQWLGSGFDSPERQAQAAAALAAAAGTIRALTGQHLTRVDDDVAVMDWNGDQSLFLPELPVTDVALVEARAALDDPDTWVEWPAGQLQWSMRSGELVLACEPWTGWASGTWPPSWLGTPGRMLGGVRVTYSHGYDPAPPELVGVAYGMAARMLDAPGGAALSSETIGGYSYQMNTAAILPAGGGWAAGLTGPEAAVIARYRTVNRA